MNSFRQKVIPGSYCLAALFLRFCSVVRRGDSNTTIKQGIRNWKHEFFNIIVVTRVQYQYDKVQGFDTTVCF